MGFFQKLTVWNRASRRDSQASSRKPKSTDTGFHYEKLETRQVLAALPVIAGITYLEGDSGLDDTPDYFEVSFEGGSPTTEMTRFVLNGDQDGSGDLSDGDMFFDIDADGPGTGGYHPFVFSAGGSVGIVASDIREVTVGEDGLSLTVDVENFEAGDVLAFTIDVDEVEAFRFDKIASGVEFESTLFQAEYRDPHYTFEDLQVEIDVQLEDGFVQPQQQGFFYDDYDQLFEAGRQQAGEALQLNLDNETGQANRSAGAIDAHSLRARPVTLSGTVYHDPDQSCDSDGEIEGIAGVMIELQKWNDDLGRYETVTTTLTDANGDYEFGAELDLRPGRYRLIETQPEGLLDVRAETGTVNGDPLGQVVLNGNQQANIISQIDLGLGGTAAIDYDFVEVRPVSISGTVWHDRNNDGQRDPAEEGIANVLIRITRVDSIEATPSQNQVDSSPIFVRTDANGNYHVDALPPGVYEILEINNDPSGGNPLAAYLDGIDSRGTVDGVPAGVTGSDRFSQLHLCAGEAAVDFNFGELEPARIDGFVSVTTPEGDCLDPAHPDYTGIGGVEIQLLDQQGNLIASTLTAPDGFYEFTDLRPGIYTIVEVQPEMYLDGGDHRGTVDGMESPGPDANDRFENIVVRSGSEASRFDFCEQRPASIGGIVWHDRNDNGQIDAGEEGIADVRIELFDETGNLIASTTTDANGNYAFDRLYPGSYTVREIQPALFADGQDMLGEVISFDGTRTASGLLANDRFQNIDLVGGDEGVAYNFGEVLLGSITGRVHADVDLDCDFEPSRGDRALEGVEIILLDAEGRELDRTFTDQNGEYRFEGLRPGEYAVREIGPAGFLDGSEHRGTVDGTEMGSISNDLISGIVLQSGSEAAGYDFCEHVPAAISGTVYHDRNDNGQQGSGEEGIGGVRLTLLDANGDWVAETVTDESGNYQFDGLLAGEYCIVQSQPEGFVDGRDTVGTIDGQTVGISNDDQFCEIRIRGGQEGTDYDFGELKLAEISGYVHLDPDGDCRFDRDAGESGIEGVTLQLWNDRGELVGTTVTDAAGYYQFQRLLPGTYTVRQIQPEGLFTAGEAIADTPIQGSPNAIRDIRIESGQRLTEHNFCENEPAEIRGRVWADGPAFENESGTVPEGYRDLRDGEFNEGVDTPLEGVRLRLYFYPDAAGSDLRPVTLDDVIQDFYPHLSGQPSDTALWVETSASGFYRFRGLPAGTYLVLEIQPEGYVDANDLPGSTGGTAFNSDSAADSAEGLDSFNSAQVMDSLAGIPIQYGQLSVRNDFTEVVVEVSVQTPGLEPPDPIPTTNPLPPGLPGTQLPWLYGPQSASVTQAVATSGGFGFQATTGGSFGYTWHLSVINGGTPRAMAEAFSDSGSAAWRLVSHLNASDWNRFDLQQGQWQFGKADESGTWTIAESTVLYGVDGGIPLAGDFDGDGVDELAVYREGYWLIDVNGNGRWDENDLMANLGDIGDKPVVGDWDGDGKDDIGIFGPMWTNDGEAIAREPGLPNADNAPMTRPKNMPPLEEGAADGLRTMKLTQFGQERADVVDHVFGISDGGEVPLAGDWNGDGIRSIGTFRNGAWKMDLDGDGEFDRADAFAQFGQEGDIPIVGDFDGDGVEQIGVYRKGTWIIDSNGNRTLDATDRSFEMGTSADQPVVGDFDGDGTDEPALYRDGSHRDY